MTKHVEKHPYKKRCRGAGASSGEAHKHTVDSQTELLCKWINQAEVSDDLTILLPFINCGAILGHISRRLKVGG